LTSINIHVLSFGVFFEIAKLHFKLLHGSGACMWAITFKLCVSDFGSYAVII
jgi:hypothetical protein